MCEYKEKLPAEMYDYAREKLGETSDVREKCLIELNEWLDENPHINANRDATVLLHFLRGSKFRMDKVKRRIEMYVFADSLCFGAFVVRADCFNN